MRMNPQSCPERQTRSLHRKLFGVRNPSIPGRGQQFRVGDEIYHRQFQPMMVTRKVEYYFFVLRSSWYLYNRDVLCIRYSEHKRPDNDTEGSAFHLPNFSQFPLIPPAVPFRTCNNCITTQTEGEISTPLPSRITRRCGRKNLLPKKKKKKKHN